MRLKEKGREYQSRESLLALANEITIEDLPPECLAYVGLELTRLDFELGPTILERLVSEYSDSYYTPFAYFGFAIKEADNKEYGLALGWLNRMGSEAANLPIFVDSMILEGKLRTKVKEYAAKHRRRLKEHCPFGGLAVKREDRMLASSCGPKTPSRRTRASNSLLPTRFHTVSRSF